ncbi:MAG: lectin like domain-containing protein [Lentihominibacter sp.]
MTIRQKLIALFVAIVFLLGTAYVPETAFAGIEEEIEPAESLGTEGASPDREEEQEDILLTPIKGQKQDDLLRPIGGNTPAEDDLVQDASGDQVAAALGDEGNELPAAYTENLGKAKIRDQGLTSLCWAFSAATIAELNRGKSAGDYTSYSPAHFGYFFYNRMNDPLGNTAGDKNTIAYSGETYASLGGSIVYGFQAMANWTGMAGESAYPYSSYVSGSSAKAIGTAFAYDNQVIVESAEMLYDQTEIKQAVLDNGGVEIGYCAGGSSSEYYHVEEGGDYEGIITHYRSEGTANHAVTIIGWDDNIPKECFGDAATAEQGTPEVNGGWLVQNSWGEANRAYFYISYGESVVSPYTFRFRSSDTYDYNFQYDGNAVNAKRGMSAGDRAANIYTVPSGRGQQSLEAVGFTTWDNGRDRDNEKFTVKIYKNLKDKSRPDSGTLVGTYEFTAPNPGYHTFELGEKILLQEGSTFSVVVIPRQYSWLGVERAANGGWVSFSCSLGKNQSMSSPAGSSGWNDAYYTGYGECFRIKAFTNSTDNIGFYPKQLQSTFTYNGRNQTPKITVAKLNLVPMTEGRDYKVNYPSSSKYVGTYETSVAGLGDYSGVKKLKFRILPQKTGITKLYRGSRKFTAKWSKRTAQVSGYQLSYATKSNFSNGKTVTITRNYTTKRTVKKLKRRTRYYVRVRTYKTVKGTRYYSSWSSVKSVKTR